MSKIIAALVASLIASPALAVDTVAHVGIENWIFGHANQFPFTLGKGGDIKLKRVWGVISGARQAVAKVGAPYSRQSLVTLLVPSLTWGSEPNATAGTAPNSGKGVHYGVDNNLAAWNLKQTGNAVVHIPVAIRFEVPLTVPGGLVYIVVDSETAGSTAPGNASTPKFNSHSSSTNDNRTHHRPRPYALPALSVPPKIL
jgi:hypothetical protein